MVNPKQKAQPKHTARKSSHDINGKFYANTSPDQRARSVQPAVKKARVDDNGYDTVVKLQSSENVLLSYDKVAPQFHQLERQGNLMKIIKSNWENKEDLKLVLQKIAMQSKEYVPAIDQGDMLEDDWMIIDDVDEDVMKIRFKSDTIELGSENYDSSDLGIAEVKNGPGFEVTVDSGGCEECSSDEIYHFQLQVLQDDLRIKVVRWIECRCNTDDGEAEKIDPDTYYAVKRISDSDDDDNDEDDEDDDDDVQILE
jgi:hypothetical protein